MDTFQVIKEKVLSFIEKSEQVTRFSNQTSSGVYMLYVDFFDDERYLPIYIGKSNNIQKRYKEHIIKLLSLNRFSYEYYYDCFFSRKSSIYEGSFYICKFFQYLVNNNLSINDVKMCVLELCDEGQLDIRELFYIDECLAPFLGFNQLNSFNDLIKNKHRVYEHDELEDLSKVYLTEIDNFIKFMNFGYTKFNLNHAFRFDSSKFNHDIKYTNFVILIEKFVNENVIINQDKRYIILKEEKRVLAEAIRKLENKKNNLQQVAYMHYDSIPYKSKKQLSLEEFVYDIDEIIVHNSFKSIGKRSAKRLIKLMNNDYLEYINVFNELREYQGEKFKNNSDICEIDCAFRKERYLDIFPSEKYSRYPLGKLEHKEVQDANVPVLENTINVKFFFSSNTRKLSKYISPFLYRVDVLISLEKKITSKQYYIDNKFTQLLLEAPEYFEYDIVRNRLGSISFSFKLELFNPVLYDCESMWINDFITINTEYNNGDNDLSLTNDRLVDLKEVLLTIDKELQLNDLTIVVESSEGNSVFIPAIEEISKIHDSLFIEKIKNRKLRSSKLVVRKKNKKVYKNTSTIKMKKTEEEKFVRKEQHYKQRLKDRFGDNVVLVNYGSKNVDPTYMCGYCNYIWTRRSDRIFSRPKCSNCGNNLLIDNS